jgi:hypothetical protein
MTAPAGDGNDSLWDETAQAIASLATLNPDHRPCTVALCGSS